MLGLAFLAILASVPADVAGKIRPEDLRALVEKVAWPPLSVPVPSVAAPSLNVTVPVGVPVPGEFTVTVAVNVTD